MNGQRSILRIVAIAAFAFLVIGCGEEEEITQVKPGPDRPENPDEVIEGFKAAYTAMNLDDYRILLHPDYLFKFQQFDIDNLGLPSDHLNCDDELQVAENMFSGNATGRGEPGITAIVFDFLEAEGMWDTSYNPAFPNALRRIYNFELRVERSTSHTMEIRGVQEFYVAQLDSVRSNGTTLTYWQLVGQVDMSQTGVKGVEAVSWGGLKALYK